MTGQTIRTLRYYDEIGLLKPVETTETGYRLYSLESVSKLYQILSLKEMGFSLDEIADLFKRKEVDLDRVIDLQLTRTQEEIAQKQLLLQRLYALQEKLRRRQHLSLEEFQATVSFLQSSGDRYFSHEQFEKLKNQGIRVQEEKEMGQDWLRFITRLKDCQQRNAPLSDPVAQECVAFWEELTRTVVGKDQELEASVFQFHAEEQKQVLRYGLSNELYSYLQCLLNQ